MIPVSRLALAPESSFSLSCLFPNGLLDIQGLMLEGETIGFGVEIPPIPGVLLIPGNIAFLNEFFEVLVLVSNVAPTGSELVITSASAEIELPLGDDGFPGTTASPGDDPLVPAETLDAQEGWTEVALTNQTTGDAQIGPGEDAAGNFLLEAWRVGTHRVTVEIDATLTFPGGPPGGVDLHGSARGTVS